MQRDKQHMLGIFVRYAASQVLSDAWKKGYIRTTLRKNSTSFVTGYESYWAYLERNMLGRSSSSARMHPRCDESSLLRHWRMAWHTVRNCLLFFFSLRYAFSSYCECKKCGILLANGYTPRYISTIQTRVISILYFIFLSVCFNRLFIIISTNLNLGDLEISQLWD